MNLKRVESRDGNRQITPRPRALYIANTASRAVAWPGHLHAGELMRIHTDHNGVYVNAFGDDMEGHLYQIVAGSLEAELRFQKGPLKEAGMNGITNAALLAILAHRIQYLNGKFPCRENAIALTKVQEAAHWLEHRTKDRMNRGVEGENKA